MNCAKCGNPTTAEESFDIDGARICRGCFFGAAAAMRGLEEKDRRRLKASVKEELDGLLPREELRSLIEEGYGRLLEGTSEFDEEVGRMVNSVERLTGIATLRQILDVIEGFGKGMDEAKEEIRARMRRIAGLDRRQE